MIFYDPKAKLREKTNRKVKDGAQAPSEQIDGIGILFEVLFTRGAYAYTA